MTPDMTSNDLLSKSERIALGDIALEADLAHIAQALVARGWMLATAESCTGGLIAGACTDLAGSSRWFERGFVTYSNAAKSDLLGVPVALIETHGAVSEAVARAMAEGAVARSLAQVSVAVTGVAGPGAGARTSRWGRCRSAGRWRAWCAAKWCASTATGPPCAAPRSSTRWSGWRRGSNQAFAPPDSILAASHRRSSTAWASIPSVMGIFLCRSR